MDKKYISASDETASIGVCFDVPHDKETIIIGNPDSIKKFFTVGIAEKIDVRERRLGTLLEEMDALAKDESIVTGIISAFDGLLEVIKSGKGNKAAAGYVAALSDLYGDNILLNYIVFFVLTNFNISHKALAGENHILQKELKKSKEKYAEQFNSCVTDMLLPFRNLPADNNIRYWNIDEQINAAPTDLILHTYFSRSSGEWVTGYVADNSFLSILRIYVDVLKQANRVVCNCAICRKLILLDNGKTVKVCDSEECRKEKHRLDESAARESRTEESPAGLYDAFARNCSNLRRKLGKDSDARKQYDAAFKAARDEALKKKKGLSPESPNQDIYAFSSFLFNKESELRKLADELIK